MWKRASRGHRFAYLQLVVGPREAGRVVVDVQHLHLHGAHRHRAVRQHFQVEQAARPAARTAPPGQCARSRRALHWSGPAPGSRLGAPRWWMRRQPGPGAAAPTPAHEPRCPQARRGACSSGTEYRSWVRWPGSSRRSCKRAARTWAAGVADALSPRVWCPPAP